MRSKRHGFTLVELMISIAILTMISITTVFSLRRTREKDELNTAVRLLTSDIKNVESRALSARNVLTCTVAGGGSRVCETENASPSPCVGTCTAAPPPHFGMSFTGAQESYSLFADVGTADWRFDGPDEVLLTRSLNPLGGGKVTVSSVRTELGGLPSAVFGVGRQNGMMRIEACGDAGLPACAPTEPKILQITLRHMTSGDTAVVEINALTGRVSIQ